MRPSSLATVALLLVTGIWGSTFFVIKDAVSLMSPIDFLAARFAIGAAVPAVVFLPRLLRLSGRHWLAGLGIGSLFGAGQIAQTIGLQTTAASVSGFITSVYVVLTPLVAWLVLRARPTQRIWVAVALATTGLGVLGLTGAASFGVGEALTLLSAAIYAVHIVALGSWAGRMDAVALAVVQLIAVAAICLVAGAPGGYDIPPVAAAWGAIAYTGLAAGIVTMVLQTWAQRHIAPTRTGLLMTLEPVFAALFAVLLGGEDFGVRLLFGGSLVLAASVVGVRGVEGAGRAVDGVADSRPRHPG